MNKVVSKFVVFWFFVLGLVLATSGSVVAKHYRYMCQGEHLHYGSSSGQPTRSKALKAAINDWAGFTAFEYGDHYAHWRIAKNKRVGCRRSTGSWNCSIQATPCRRNR